MTSTLGIDIGGTGIKGALVDVDSGELQSERMKLATPAGAEPDAVVQTVLELIGQLGGIDPQTPVGVCFPSVIKNGRTLTANNISDKWIGIEAEALFERALHRDIRFINDADAAGVAEERFGAARDVPGIVILTTLGTGIGSAVLQDGVLLPNTELGQLLIKGKPAERRASAMVRQRQRLSWARWAARLQVYYEYLERLFTPDLFIVGGGVSKQSEDFLPLLKLHTPIVPAVQRNNAGIIGAALLAGKH